MVFGKKMNMHHSILVFFCLERKEVIAGLVIVSVDYPIFVYI
jgi:hypothetical protein